MTPTEFSFYITNLSVCPLNSGRGEMDKGMIYGSENFLDKAVRGYKIEAINKTKRETEKGWAKEW